MNNEGNLWIPTWDEANTTLCMMKLPDDETECIRVVQEAKKRKIFKATKNARKSERVNAYQQAYGELQDQEEWVAKFSAPLPMQQLTEAFLYGLDDDVKNSFENFALMVKTLQKPEDGSWTKADEARCTALYSALPKDESTGAPVDVDVARCILSEVLDPLHTTKYKAKCQVIIHDGKAKEAESTWVWLEETMGYKGPHCAPTPDAPKVAQYR